MLARLVAAAEDMYDALVGDDPEAPRDLQPIGILAAIVRDYGNMVKRHGHEDTDAAWWLVTQAALTLERLEAALDKAEGGDEQRHAIRYALTAIDEHLEGARIDWDDVRDVLRRAIGEKTGQ
ncbi:MAG TPA: hypothetical protein VF171_07185 [Trueperaceae bacterium]